MKHIHLVELQKYQDPIKYKKVADGIYKALFDYEDGVVKTGHYVTAFSFTLEEELGETRDRQYPLEDVLDKFPAHVSEFVQYDVDNPVMKLELCTQGWLDKMEQLLQIVEKHVFNRRYIENGKTYVQLVIE